jgi:hypothetical protein
VAITLLTFAAQPLAAFDTFWHSAATAAMARQFHFSDDADNIVQFGNFSGPDFFGPLYDVVLGKKIEDIEKWATETAGLDKADPNELKVYEYHKATVNVRKAAIYMHFDDLNGKLDSNAKFDYLFTRLLKNTQKLLGELGASNLPEGTKKIAILMALGCSLHMVQDFYSHSDWTHNDFESLGVPLVKTSWGKERAPTWFEFKAKYPDVRKWPFRVRSGMYPPKGDTPYIHTHMNHDNSQLFYKNDVIGLDGKTTSVLQDQAKYHEAGAYPVSKAGAKEHQLFSINTAAGASIEWVTMIQQDPVAKMAIEYARTWVLQGKSPMTLHDLENCLAVTLAFSCLANKWDGDNPPPARAAPCRGVRTFVGGAGAAAVAVGPMGALGGGIITATGLSLPLATIFMNEFWAVHTQQKLVEHLTEGYSSQSGNYVFPVSVQ